MKRHRVAKWVNTCKYSDILKKHKNYCSPKIHTTLFDSLLYMRAKKESKNTHPQGKKKWKVFWADLLKWERNGNDER